MILPVVWKDQKMIIWNLKKLKRSTMKTIRIRKAAQLISIFILILVFALASCYVVDPIDHVSDTNFSAKAPFSFDIPVNEQKHIEIEGINGQITISGEAGLSSVKIWGERIVQSDSYADAEEHLENLEVLVSDGHDKINVKTDQPTVTHGRSYQVIYNIIIPDNWDVAVENVNGQIEIDSLNADIAIGLVNGDLVLTNILGNIITGVTNGTIYGKITLPVNGICAMCSVNGQIQLGIPRTTSAALTARVTNGTVSVTNLTLNNMVSSRNSVCGTIGSGQGTISVESVNGTISVSGF
jgi:hypothetical protein